MEFVVPSTIRSKSTRPILPALIICIKCLIIIACHMFQDTLLYNINFLILENHLSLDRSCLVFPPAHIKFLNFSFYMFSA